MQMEGSPLTRFDVTVTRCGVGTYTTRLNNGAAAFLFTCLRAACLRATRTPTSPGTTTPTRELCRRDKCRRMLEVLGRAVVPRKTCLTYTLGHIKYATVRVVWSQQRLRNSELVLYYFHSLQQYFKCVFMSSQHMAKT